VQDRTDHGRGFGVAGVAAAVLLLLVTACRHDGRDLRDPTSPLPAVTTTTVVGPDTVGDPDAAGLTLPPVSSAEIGSSLAPTAVFQLVTPWPDGAAIPTRNTCDDVDVAPALSWTGVPAGTVELAITMTDLTRDFTHWLVTGIDPTVTGLAEGELPAGAVVYTNDFEVNGWSGPCPPAGDEAHQYLFTVHALNQQLVVADDAASDEVVSLLNQTAVTQSSVSGTYARSG
jgi:Raf kinase inhibitor-like YbhB/YbcL family protein